MCECQVPEAQSTCQFSNAMNNEAAGGPHGSVVTRLPPRAAASYSTLVTYILRRRTCVFQSGIVRK